MISKLLVVGLFLSVSSGLRAEGLDGYIGISGGMNKHLTASDTKGSRYDVRIDFARLQKSIALDLRLGNGMKYSDIGGAFKIFEHFAFSDSTSTGVSLGTGLGATYSRAGVTGVDKSFYDVFVPAFARVMFDFGFGGGLFVDFEYQAMFMRRYPSGDVSDSRDLAHRFYIGAGIAISAL